MGTVDFITRNRSIVLIIAIPLIIMFIFVREVSVLSALIIASLILSYFMGQWRMKAVGLELVMLIAVLTGMTYGPMAGAIIAFVMIVIHMIATEHVNAYLLWVIPGYSIVGFLAGATELSIRAFGIYATLGLNLINLMITAIIFRENVGKFMPFAITNVMFNLFLFFFIAPGLMDIMKA